MEKKLKILEGNITACIYNLHILKGFLNQAKIVEILKEKNDTFEHAKLNNSD